MPEYRDILYAVTDRVAVITLNRPDRLNAWCPYSYLQAIPKPIIAAINGPAAGLGFILPLCCDIRFASEKARSLAVMKRQVYEAQFQTLDEATVAADEGLLLSLASEDFKEGVAHFIEKRPPNFTGR